MEIYQFSKFFRNGRRRWQNWYGIECSTWNGIWMDVRFRISTFGRSRPFLETRMRYVKQTNTCPKSDGSSSRDGLIKDHRHRRNHISSLRAGHSGNMPGRGLNGEQNIISAVHNKQTVGSNTRIGHRCSCKDRQKRAEIQLRWESSPV